MSKHCIVFMLLIDDSQVSHTMLIDIQDSIYYVLSINYLHVQCFLIFGILFVSLWIVYVLWKEA